MQYALFAIIPVVILNKSIQRFVPEADEEKGTPEILAEVVFQVVAMFLGILLIHKLYLLYPLIVNLLMLNFMLQISYLLSWSLY